MLEDILASLPKQVAKDLKSQKFWPIFSPHVKVYRMLPSYVVVFIEVCVCRYILGKEVTEFLSK